MIDPNFDLPGWSTAIDPRTGRQYFINLQEKTTTWEDPRTKLRNVYGNAIPIQTLHGSPKKSQVQVYPTQSYPAQAFQSYPSGQSVNASPIASTKTSHHSHTVEMSSLSRSSPHTPRIGNLIKNHQMQQQQMETSFSTQSQSSNPTAIETDAAVAKINQIFPTASEHHIRLLLKKYLKSMFPKCEEIIILDVLAMVENNVQKASEQLIQMGYEKREMTPAPRLSYRKLQENQPKLEAAQPTPPPKPKTAEEKKKLKARLQSQYKDTIPEKIVLMALESVDYSEEKALKILDIVLQEDKDFKKKSEKKKGEVEKNVSFKDANLRGSKSIDLDSAAAIENDETMIINSDHSIITTPIESPGTDVASTSGEQEKKIKSDDTSTSESSVSEAIAIEKSKRHRPKARSESNRSEKNVPVVAKKDANRQAKKVMFEDVDESFLSILSRSTTVGPNTSLAKGPKDDILLTDYVIWNGANPDIMKGHRAGAKGPNASLLIDRTYTSRGRSSELCKGPKIGLAKGSMYTQILRPNVACN